MINRILLKEFLVMFVVLRKYFIRDLACLLFLRIDCFKAFAKLMLGVPREWAIFRKLNSKKF